MTQRHYLKILCQCGHRLGQHRWGDDACPNPYWRAGNGKPQWRDPEKLGAFRAQRAEAVAPWGAS